MKVNTAVAAILLATAAATEVVAQTPQPTTGSQQPAPPPAAPFGTPIAAELAQQKAAAAARYRRPTKAFYDGIEAGHLFFLTFPGIAGAPGGAPIVVDGKLVGAIGVSGGNGEQDVEISGAGISASR